MLACRRTILGDGHHVAPRQCATYFCSIPHSCAQHDDTRISPQVMGNAHKPTHDERNVGAGHPPPVVRLVDDDEVQRRQETRPPRVRWQHDIVQEIRVRQDQVRARASPLFRLARRVAVYRCHVHAAQPFIDEAGALSRISWHRGGVVLTEQRHQRSQLVGGEGFRRRQVQGRWATANRRNSR